MSKCLKKLLLYPGLAPSEGSGLQVQIGEPHEEHTQEGPQSAGPLGVVSHCSCACRACIERDGAISTEDSDSLFHPQGLRPLDLLKGL